jgi:hypothetical protein
MLYLQEYISGKMSIMTIKSFLGKKIKEEGSHKQQPLIVSPRHSAEDLNGLTKKEVIAYAHKHNILINSRKKKEELIEIIIRS